jgi:hypothetical protein
MCLFMSMKCILVWLKFDIDINNVELLEIIWKQNIVQHGAMWSSNYFLKLLKILINKFLPCQKSKIKQ